MLLPALTVLDEAVSAGEGSIDPLGLYSIADNLAVQMVPGVRERQRRPRFLTIICASAALCQHFEPDAMAEDGVSEPWQVFEWYIVEGLVRRISDNSRLRNLPGRDKVASAVLKDRVPVSSRRYLKTPTVFGFHGIYRVLARTLGIERHGELDEHGYQLLDVWESERGLDGFWTSRTGCGRAWREKLCEAVADGLKRGSTARSGTWEGWDFIANHLAHDAAGTGEKCLLSKFLVDGEVGFRKEVLGCLVSASGQKAWRPDESSNEGPFHDALAAVASPHLKTLLTAIRAYEAFARQIRDAFYCCLHALSISSQPVSAMKLATLSPVVEGRDRTPDLFRAAQDALEPLALSARLSAFLTLAEQMSVGDWVEALLAHHDGIQRAKPPNGKAPWVIRYDDGQFIVRPHYRVEEFEPNPDLYVHQYRTLPLTSFAQDLGLIQ